MNDPSSADRVLEICCAAGHHATRLAPRVAEVAGVDYAPAAIDRAAEPGATNVDFPCWDDRRLEMLADASFDNVAEIDFVEQVDDDAPLGILDEIHRVLRPDGTLSILTPCASHNVERPRARNRVLCRVAAHVAVRGEAKRRGVLERTGFGVADLRFARSTCLGARWPGRWLWHASVVGPWFRFQTCIVARPRLA